VRSWKEFGEACDRGLTEALKLFSDVETDHLMLFRSVAFNLFGRIPPHVISLQLFTPKFLVFNSSYKQSIIKQQTSFLALVRERTIPTERPPLVGEFSVNFCG
jgi:hypothetical protein